MSGGQTELKMIFTLILILVSVFKGYVATRRGYIPSTYIWPLGEEIMSYERMTGGMGTTSDVTFAPGPPELDYDAMMFDATTNSSLAVIVNPNVAMESDFAFQVWYYPMTDGVFLHYISTDRSGPGVQEIRLELRNGDIGVRLTSGVTEQNLTASVDIIYNAWHRISVGRDVSNDGVIVVVDGSEKLLSFGTWLTESRTLSPGTLQLGGPITDGFHITGKMACLQLVAFKNPKGEPDYDTECLTNTWPTAILYPAQTPFSPVIGCTHTVP